MSEWRKWGPYLAERQWGTVREDYSDSGDAWEYFPFEMAASRAYRWGEDGIGGISDEKQKLCFAFAFWNGKDPILKERFYGLSNSQGNHGEDVKECYYYLDNTPKHDYMSMLYKYPHCAFPYEQLKNHNRSLDEPELKLVDTGVFNEDRYFDIHIEYAKSDPEDILVRCTVHNSGPEEAIIHVLPTLWLRNTWIWHNHPIPSLIEAREGYFLMEHPDVPNTYLYFENDPTPLFTNNETNGEKLFQSKNVSPFVKDAFHEAVIHENKAAVNPDLRGTKSALHYTAKISKDAPLQIRLRLSNQLLKKPFADFDSVFVKRKKEADDFYQAVVSKRPELQQIQRQAWAGLLWNKQYYRYVVEEWLHGDAPESLDQNTKRAQRNHRWRHFYSGQILSVPDKWEFPWFASWDTAFQSVAIASIDPEFAKEQLILLTHEWFMHPNGQVPSHEWDFEDVNPPILAWAALKVYEIDKKRDRLFLERLFQKLLLTFTWWVNRKDTDGLNIFEGGFLGLDNIGLFNRSIKLPLGVRLIQSDATSWMAMFCINMSTIALELADKAPHYEEMGAKFLSHFLLIAEAINAQGGLQTLWDPDDQFYYDLLTAPSGESWHLKIRSLVGLIPILAVATIDAEKFKHFSAYKKRFFWLLQQRPYLSDQIACLRDPGKDGRRLVSLLTPNRLRQLLAKVLDETEFFSDYGIRSLSRFHKEHPFCLNLVGREFKADYEPAESTNKIFGGNSNWRGPIWMPLNYLLIEALETYAEYLEDDFTVECPTGSGKFITLKEAAREISKRLVRIFELNPEGNRPCLGDAKKFDHLLFHEYFHGDTGKGLGASHQTGWTSLIASLISKLK